MDDFDLVNDFDRIFDGGGDYVDVSRRPLGTARREDAEPEGWVAPEKPAPEQKSARGMNSLSEDEKPREKALRQGIDALTDTELLAILLGSGIPGKSVLELSREILRDNDNRLAYLSRKSIPEIVRKYKGIGTAKAALLVAAMTFGARAQTDLQIQDPRIASSQEVYAFMRGVLGVAPQSRKPSSIRRTGKQRGTEPDHRRCKTDCEKCYRPAFIGDNPVSQPSVGQYGSERGR